MSLPWYADLPLLIVLCILMGICHTAVLDLIHYVHIFTLTWHSPAMKHKETGKYFPMNATGHVMEKLTFVFFYTFDGLFVALA